MHFFEKPNNFVQHVAIKVSNLTRSLDYYTNTIGLFIIEQNSTHASLGAKNSTTPLLHLEEVKNASARPASSTGLYHFAILLRERKHLANIIRFFSNNNVRLGASDHDVSEALYLNDPDGNGIEIYVDRPEEQWTWQQDIVHMTTDPLNVQSIMQEESGVWDGMPEGTVMGHVHLNVANIPASEKFYTEGLAFNVVTRYGPSALFVSTGGYHHHIGLNTWASNGGHPAPATSVGLSYVAFQLDDDAQQQHLVERLRAIGAAVELVDGGFNTVDPAGNALHFRQ
ncbi:VOC family protein [Caryophanon latum]|uniref:Glyoxalase n=1 Tax=Caryophanon latum TaxID=33977 RepID=A0A1C0YFX1_9BACL|nr:VOC family protein [Caryophanon latum]OCS86029.1 glyoxalase [Caryophanon latum]